MYGSSELVKKKSNRGSPPCSAGNMKILVSRAWTKIHLSLFCHNMSELLKRKTFIVLFTKGFSI